MSVYVGGEKISEIYVGGEKISEGWLNDECFYRSELPAYLRVIDALTMEPGVTRLDLPADGNHLVLDTTTHPEWATPGSALFQSQYKPLLFAFIMLPGESFTLKTFVDSVSNTANPIHISYQDGVVTAAYSSTNLSFPANGPALVVQSLVSVYVNSDVKGVWSGRNVIKGNTGLLIEGRIANGVYVKNVKNGDYGVHAATAGIDSYYKGGVFKVPIDLAGELLA